MKRGIKHEVPSLSKELLEIVNCQEEQSILIILQPLVKLTTLRLIPHIQEYLWIKKGPFKKKRHYCVGREGSRPGTSCSVCELGKTHIKF